jgi:hypothetical protein
LHPKRLPEWVLPGFLGRIDRLASEEYWGRPLESDRMPYLISIYFGGLTLTLAAIGWGAARTSAGWPASHRGFLAGVLALSLILSFGRYAPIIQDLYRYPPLAWFRFPVKFLLAWPLPIALLAAWGTEALWVRGRPVRKSLLTALAVGGALLTSWWVLWSVAPETAEAWGRAYFHQWTSRLYTGLGQSLLHAVIVWWGMTLLFFYRAMVARPWQAALVAGLLAVDLGVASLPVNPYAPRQMLTDVPPIVSSVRAFIGNGRLFRIWDPDEARQWELLPPENDIVYKTRWDLETLNLWIGAYYKIPVIFHINVSGIQQRRIENLTEALYAVPWERRLPALSAGSVTVVVTPEILRIEGLRPVVRVRSPSILDYYVYHNERAMPPVHFVSHYRFFKELPHLLSAMLNPAFDPRREVLLLGTGPSGGTDCSHEVSYQRPSNHRLLAVVQSTCPGYLVWAETHYPGWQVRVDGTPRPVLSANYAFMAVEVPAGRHSVEWTYLPTSIPVGVVLSLVCGIGVAVTVVRTRRRAGHSERAYAGFDSRSPM